MYCGTELLAMIAVALRAGLVPIPVRLSHSQSVST